jgi:membrane-bound lytic murein transglycosylase D
MNCLKYYLLPLLWLSFAAFNPLAATGPDKDIPPYNEEEIMARLAGMDQDFIETKYEPVVEGYIKGYVVRKRRNAEIILGRSATYFPIFEKYLAEKNMPDMLKYLAVVESALNPHAVSVVGAGGLWQFMPETGKSYGLIINNEIDERTDVIKSTKAAIEHLEDLYERYDDWALALAAYNSGAGRVNRAIRRSGSKDFWKLRKYLPRETRNYVPAFISAVYLAHYYDKHNLQPDFPPLDMQLTEAIEINDFVSYFRIAQLTGVSIDVIRKLNPLYTKDYIPASERGNYLILPRRVMPAFKEYLLARKAGDAHPEALYAAVKMKSSQNTDKPYSYSIYLLGDDEAPEKLADMLNCSVTNLMVWNEVGFDGLANQRQLKVFESLPVNFERREAPVIEPLPVLGFSEISSMEESLGK